MISYSKQDFQCKGDTHCQYWLSRTHENSLVSRKCFKNIPWSNKSITELLCCIDNPAQFIGMLFASIESLLVQALSVSRGNLQVSEESG